MRKDYEIEIEWVAFPLHPEIPEEGLALEELFAGRPVDIDRMMAHLKKVAEQEGLPLTPRQMTYNTRLAQELGKWAETCGKGDEFHNTVFQAYFVHGKNIGKTDELLPLAESVGLPGKEGQEVLETRSFREAVDMDWLRAHAKGITAVPTFLINDQTVVGAQPYEVLERLMQVNNVRRRSGYSSTG